MVTWLTNSSSLSAPFSTGFCTGGVSRARPWIRFWNRTIVLAVRQLYRQASCCTVVAIFENGRRNLKCNLQNNATQRTASKANQARKENASTCETRPRKADRQGRCKAREANARRIKPSQARRQDAKTKDKAGKAKDKAGTKTRKANCVLSPSVALCLLSQEQDQEQEQETRARAKRASARAKARKKPTSTSVWFGPYFRGVLCASHLSNKRESKSEDRKDKTSRDFRCRWVRLPSPLCGLRSIVLWTSIARGTKPALMLSCTHLHTAMQFSSQ